MIHRTPTQPQPASQARIMAVGTVAGNGETQWRVAPPPANADTVLAAMSWGRTLFYDGEPRYHCRNAHEEAGYDEAAAECAMPVEYAPLALSEWEMDVQEEIALHDWYDVFAEDTPSDLEDDMLDREFWASGRW